MPKFTLVIIFRDGEEFSREFNSYAQAEAEFRLAARRENNEELTIYRECDDGRVTRLAHCLNSCVY